MIRTRTEPESPDLETIAHALRKVKKELEEAKKWIVSMSDACYYDDGGAAVMGHIKVALQLIDEALDEIEG